MNTVIGVDGCKTGWFYFQKQDERITYGVAGSFKELMETAASISRLYIDIPIGLLDGGSEGRACDMAARKLLGQPRSSSVFPAPYRPVLSVTNYLDAKQISLEVSGKKISQQAFAITPKIREVDDYLVKNIEARKVVREIHPELCFWALNNRSAMINGKKLKAGFEERIHVLEKILPNTRDIISGPLNEYLRKEVAADDIMDALVALVVACTSSVNLQTAPPKPQTDSVGLPMEMVYTEKAGEGAF